MCARPRSFPQGDTEPKRLPGEELTNTAPADRAAAAGDALALYRAKRDPRESPEPGVATVAAGSGPAAAHGGIFVIQLHQASSLHYDLRLEVDGVLRSWAVPRGFSADPAVKALAVQTENHPLEYADFEGIIPAGSYGGGAMIVWDRGRYLAPIEVHDGERKGKLLIEFRGFKLRGTWTLVRIAKQSKAASVAAVAASRRADATTSPIAAEERRADLVAEAAERDQRGDPALRLGGASPFSPPGTEWLLIKERDAYAVAAPASADEDGAIALGYEPSSVLSGLTVDELAAGFDPGAAPRQRLAELGAKRQNLDPARLEVMKPEPAEHPFSRPGWFFEPKIDGYRLVAAREEGRVRLFYRSGHEATAVFPDLARAIGALRLARVVFDGEAAVLDANGRPSFQLLQRRTQLSRSVDIGRAAINLPAVYFAFDLLELDGYDLRPLPLSERQAVLAAVLPRAGVVRGVEVVEQHGEALYAAVDQLGLEGIVAKRGDSAYRAGRSADWRKIRVDRSGDFVVVGWNEASGRGMEFGGLHIAAASDAGLVYVGSVGSGFSAKQRSDLFARLEPQRRATPPVVAGTFPTARENVWVEPAIVLEVRFKELTADLRLRHPVLLRVRDDKSIAEIERMESLASFGDVEEPSASDFGAAALDGDGEGEEPQAAATADAISTKASAAAGAISNRAFDVADAVSNEASAAADAVSNQPAAVEPAALPLAAAAPGRLRLTNLDKVFWPEHGYTKGHLLAFYEAVAPWLLPYLADRPLVLDRYPDGIHGKNFYQKNAPDYLKDKGRGFIHEVPTVSIWSEGSTREIEYFLCSTAEDLLAIANSGAIPLHIWSSRVGSLGQPDWCILDLDPKGAPMADVVAIARLLHDIAVEVGWTPLIKTSGSSGLHVLLPLGQQVPFEPARQLAELLARLVVARLPRIATAARNPAARGGKVYVDHLQNGHGKLLAAPWSVRPLPGAPVSTALDWDEVVPTLELAAYSIVTVPVRLAERAARGQLADPLAPILTLTPDLAAILERLARFAG